MALPRAWRRAAVSWSALLPLAATVLLAYLGTVLWTLRMSVSGSRTFPKDDFVGLQQYERLFTSERWLQSLQHLALYGVLFIAASMTLGVLLAVSLDRRVRAEGLLRSVFLYPYALSFVATGLVWQWMLSPEHGIGWTADPERVLFAIVLATVWQASGLVMALVLAGLRGVDPDIWKAARVDGIPHWRVVLQIVLPMLGPSLSTAFLLLATGVVKLFDAVVAMTQGGPGTASDVPARFIMDHLFGRANLGLASAGAITMLATVLLLAAPVAWARRRRPA